MKQNVLIEGGKTLALSLILALGIRSFIAEARFIPSGSMLPTLEIDDRLIIEKVSYHFNAPQRGDIIVFTPPDTASRCSPNVKLPIKDAYIKRTIGLPGEEVRFENGRVYIDGKLLSEDYIKDIPHPVPPLEEQVKINGDRVYINGQPLPDDYVKTLADASVPLDKQVKIEGGRVYINGRPLPANYVQEFVGSPFPPTTVTVPEDAYWVLGDNRNGSCDSRVWGFVSKENIIGRAVVRFWPINRMEVGLD